MGRRTLPSILSSSHLPLFPSLQDELCLRFFMGVTNSNRGGSHLFVSSNDGEL